MVQLGVKSREPSKINEAVYSQWSQIREPRHQQRATFYKTLGQWMTPLLLLKHVPVHTSFSSTCTSLHRNRACVRLRENNFSARAGSS